MPVLCGWNDDVLGMEHSPKQLKLFMDVNSTILWEPASNKAPVYYSGVEARIIVTVLLMKFCFMSLTRVLECFHALSKRTCFHALSKRT